MIEGLMDFIFPRRLGRLNYFLRMILFNAVIFGVSEEMRPPRESADYWWIVATVLALAYATVFIILPRLRDCAMSAWFLLLLLIPIIQHVFSILITFRPSWTPLDAHLSQPHEETATGPASEVP